MDMLAILEVSIGTVMVYLVLSLVCTALLEAVIGFCGFKHKNLEKSINTLLGSVELTKKIYKDPEIAVLCGKNGRKPSYIPTDVFARSVLSLATGNNWRASGGAPSLLREKFLEFGNESDDLEGNERKAKKRLSQTLVQFIDEAAGDMDGLTNKIETWFDRTCDRSKGWFKRKINGWLIAIGLVVAALVNADTIQIFQKLSADPTLRAAAVELAQEKIDPESIPAADDGADAPALEAVRRQVGDLAPFIGWSYQDPVVVAWNDPDKNTPFAIVAKVFGLLLTAFAISLGAPFWFDLLQKLVNVRKSVVAGKPGVDSKSQPAPAASSNDKPAAGETDGKQHALPAGPMAGFNATAAKINLDNAYWLAKAADLAYETDAGKVRSTVESWGMTGHVFESQKAKDTGSWKGKFTNPDTQGFIAANENLVLVCFRGTEPTRPADVLTDLQFQPEPAGSYGEGKVHQGFKAAIDSVWDDVEAQMRSMSGNQQPVWFAGHSLGGALAVLAASRYDKETRENNVQARKNIAAIDEELEQKPDDTDLIGKRTLELSRLRGRAAGVYTIGQPRVGDDSFADDFDTRLGRNHVRIINNRDVVPRVPPRAMKFDHSGAVLYIDEFGRLHVDPGLWFRLLDTVVISREEIGKAKEGVQDHSSSLYVDMLDKARKDDSLRRALILT